MNLHQRKLIQSQHKLNIDFTSFCGASMRHPLSSSSIFMAAALSGLFTTTILQPVDIACTRVLNQPIGSQGEGLYDRGAWDCLLKTLKTEGFRGLFKGWSASYLRVGPHTALTFFFLETYRNHWGVHQFIFIFIRMLIVRLFVGSVNSCNCKCKAKMMDQALPSLVRVGPNMR